MMVAGIYLLMQIDGTKMPKSSLAQADKLKKKGIITIGANFLS